MKKTKSKIRFTGKEIKEVRKLASEGVSKAKIAKSLHRRRADVIDVLARLKIVKKKQKVTKARVAIKVMLEKATAVLGKHRDANGRQFASILKQKGISLSLAKQKKLRRETQYEERIKRINKIAKSPHAQKRIEKAMKRLWRGGRIEDLRKKEEAITLRGVTAPGDSP